MEFDKVICDNYSQEFFIDWQDDMDVDLFTVEHFKPCFDFIARPVDENLKEVRNFAHRKGLVWSINHDIPKFIKMLRKSLDLLQKITN